MSRRFGVLSGFTAAMVLSLTGGGPLLAQRAVRDTQAVLHPHATLTAAERHGFVGAYAVTMPSGERAVARIVEKDGGLFMSPGEQKGTRLEYQGDDRFQPEGIPDFVIVFTRERGRPTKFTVQKEDGLLVGAREQ